ncbi:MauE/DoxX family redox-associated membrane protein [Dokdonella sp.]|uniref:MauE/DoxX family redox-associated membrane protein n=1 Tax=Dokdonella sp. TaxID=2291710 RepID=UPI002F3FB6DC
MFAADSIRYGVAGLLAYAAASKLADFRAFRRNVTGFLKVSDTTALYLAPVVIGVEAALAAALAFDAVRRTAWLSTALLIFFVFTGLLARAHAGRDVVKCSCFGEGERPVSAHDVARNVVIATGLAFCLVVEPATDARAAVACALASAFGVLWVVVLSQFHRIVVLVLHASDGAP